LFYVVAAQVVTRETNTVKRYVDKYLKNGDTGEFESHVDDFYTNTFPDYVRMKFRPIITAYADAIDWAARSEIGVESDDDAKAELARFVEGCADTYVRRHIRSSRGQIGYILGGGGRIEPNDNVFDGVASVEPEPQIKDEDKPDALKERMDEWEERRPGKIADDEIVGLDGAVAHAVFVGQGFNLRWTAVGESCPYCESLDGMVVGHDGYFLKQDQELQPPGQKPMRIRFSKRHPPAHRGCDCMITADAGRARTEQIANTEIRHGDNSHDDNIRSDKMFGEISTVLNGMKDIMLAQKHEINISVPEPTINVGVPVVNVGVPVVNMEAPVVNVTVPERSVTVESPIISFEPPKKTKKVPVRDKSTGLIVAIEDVDDE